MKSKVQKEMKSLPKTWRGAEGVSGKSMKADELNVLIEKKALSLLPSGSSDKGGAKDDDGT